MSGKAIIFCAPSGAGKTTIVRHLLQKIESLEFSISATTRAPRSYEIHGKDYYFFTVEDFKDKVNAGQALEWEEVYEGTYYGTLREEVDRIWQEGKNVIFDVDVKGGINLKQALGDQAISIFIKVKNLDVLRDRLSRRNTESEETIKERVTKAVEEMKEEDKFDVVLVNDQLEIALNEAEQIVTDFLKQ